MNIMQIYVHQSVHRASIYAHQSVHRESIYVHQSVHRESIYAHQSVHRESILKMFRLTHDDGRSQTVCHYQML
jgi:hypothetical protein